MFYTLMECPPCVLCKQDVSENLLQIQYEVFFFKFSFCVKLQHAHIPAAASDGVKWFCRRRYAQGMTALNKTFPESSSEAVRRRVRQESR